MFESIVVCQQNKGNDKTPLDIGLLVECMLFYAHTTVFANRAVVTQLVEYFGEKGFAFLLNEELLGIRYDETKVGIITRTIGGKEYHDAVHFSSPQHTLYDDLVKIGTDVVRSSSKGKRFAKDFQDKIKVTQPDTTVLDGARESFLDPKYVNTAARTILRALVPEFGEANQIRFYTDKTSDGIRVITNMDFVKLNTLYHKNIPQSHSSITPAYILSHMLDMEEELYLSAKNAAELATNTLSAALATHKIDNILTKTMRNQHSISNFVEFLFDDAKLIREAVNSRTVEIDKLLAVLENSRRFKKWIVGLPADTNLIRQYFEEVTKESFVDKLPGKTMRWTLFTGLGLAADLVATGGMGTAAGLMLGALDTFFVDKLISGWKPDQFVNDELKTLLKADHES